MRFLLLQAAILLAVLVTCCLARHSPPPTASQCSDWSLPRSLVNTTMAELLKNFKEYHSSKNLTNMTMQCREVTVKMLIAHALNTSGNMSLTASKLGFSDTECLSYLGFTLKEVALQNLKDPDMFPGNSTVKDILDLLFSNMTQMVVHRVHRIVNALKSNYSVNVTKSIHQLTKNSHFNPYTMFVEVMCLAVNASDFDQAATRIGIDKDLLSFPFVQMTDYLFTTVDAYQKNLSLECAIRHLHSGHLFLNKLWKFLREERRNWGMNTTRELFHAYNASLESRTVLSVFKEAFSGQLNLTFLQFFGYRRVHLKVFHHKVAVLSKVLFLNESAFLDMTIKKLFYFMFVHAEVITQYEENLKLSEKRREEILSRYGCTIHDLMGPPFNLTQSNINMMKDVGVENHAMRCFFKKYADERNITLQELESRSNLTNNTLMSVTIHNFLDVLFYISKANIVQVVKEQRALVGIITHFHMVCNEGLKTQIKIERHPLATDWKYIIELETSYFIFQKSWNVRVIYNTTIYDYVMEYLKPSSWKEFLLLFGVRNPDSQELMKAFKKYTFMDLSKFYHVGNYTIFRWKLSFFIKFMVEKIEQDVDECRDNAKNPCAQIDGVQCVNFPGGVMCKCPSDKNLDRYRHCKDINECDIKTTRCRNNSRCVNTVGSYECKCKVGYEDINDECKDINECLDPSNTCAFSNADCKNTIGSFMCSCGASKRFNSLSGNCDDIDECVEQQPCKAITNSTCVNQEPGYECKCLEGFNETRHTSVAQNRPLVNCTDINECESDSLNDCHKHATCMNTVGSYTCKCKEGYKGDGRHCKDERLFEVDRSKCVIITYDNVGRKKYWKVHTDLGFYFNGKIYKKLYVYIDGKITVDKKYGKRSPKAFDNVNRNAFFPFWTEAGLISVSSLHICQVYADDGDSSSLLRKINKFVSNSTTLTNFEASWVLVVTWRNVVPSSAYPNERNTYQAVVATNGSNTVLMYFYDDGGMTWDLADDRVAVGYTLKSRSGSVQVDGSFTTRMYKIDQMKFRDPAGNERTGSLIWEFNPPAPPPPTPSEKCLAWIRKTSKKDNNWVEDLPDCPCTLSAIKFDVRFHEYLNDNGVVCYTLQRRQEKTKSCCYYTTFPSRDALVPDSDSRGGRALRYSPRSMRDKYALEDVEPYNWCCEQSTLYCGNFKQLRPVDEGCGNDDDDEPRQCDCRWRFGFRRRRVRRVFIFIRMLFFGFFFGDPHITTLDGLMFSFNGLGDYVVLETPNNRIDGRTKRPPHKDGGLSKATVFSGFALRSSKNTTIQVLFSDVMAGNFSITSYNESGNCQNFGINNLKQIPGFFLKKSTDNKTLETVFDSGLVAKITPGMGFLQISFLIPGNFVNSTRGLLGKMNNDKNDDLMFRNGTTLPISSTEKEIFSYGQTWKVQDGKGMFVNDSCSKENVFFDGIFTPLFLSDCQANITDHMRAVCKNGSECLLDYCLTGDESFANATRTFEEESEKVKKIVGNLPPTITFSPATVNAKAGKRFSVNVTAKDPNNDAVQLISNTLPDNAVFSNGQFEWTPPAGLRDQSPKPNIEFIANDTQGAVTVKPLEVRYCDCKNGGECDFNTTQRTYPNSTLQLVACKCLDNSTGDLCETPVDPCEDEPCFGNVSCTARQQPFGFQCGPCPAGLSGDGQACRDLDECLNASTNNCTQNEKCTNIIGSFKCDCKKGFKRVPNTNNCTDINECTDTGSDKNCKANTVCINKIGSFSCECKPGYQGDPLKGCEDIDECKIPKKKCFGHFCNNTEGSYDCSCKTGFKLVKQNDDTYRCEDIDECKIPITNKCTQVCKNTGGSYICGCDQGFNLDADNSSCSVKPDNKCGASNGGCVGGMCTNTSGVVTCHCSKGFNLTSDKKTCEDNNECNGQNHGCSHNCTNFSGSYNCSCRPGFKLNDDKRSCTDINECTKNNGGCNQKCTNKPGGRDCSCRSGFKKVNETTCEDINECKNITKCSTLGRECVNKPGSYKCRCKDREKFSDGKKQCQKSKKYKLKMRCTKLDNQDLVWKEDYEDESSEDYLQLEKYIILYVNRYFTRTFELFGYIGCDVIGFWQGSVMANVTLNFADNSSITAGNVTNAMKNITKLGNLVVDPSQSAVSDVDECSDGTNNCNEHATCTNKPGSFSCSCKDGYEGDGVTCKKEVDKKKKEDKTVMIILLSVLIPLAIIIIIIIICCCYRRKTKGDLHVSEDMDNPHVVTLRQTSKNGNAPNYYDNTRARRISDDYDVPEPGTGGMYDMATATYYDNPATSSETQEAKL